MIEAVTGEDGVAAAEKERPDLILMDIQLPGLDGYEATRRIKANPALRHIPIIVVTSYALSGDDVKAFEAGCDAYVTKPFGPRELLAKIREYLPVATGRLGVRTPPRILIVDDTPTNVHILQTRLAATATTSSPRPTARRRSPRPARHSPT